MVPEEIRASPGKRFTGRVVDNIVLMLPLGIAMALALSLAGDDSLWPFLIAGLVVGLGIYVALQTSQLRSTGQTLGKRVAGTRVVAVDGSAVGPFRACFGRDLLIFLANATRLLGLINGLAVFAASRRCIHDHLLGTVVVDVVLFESHAGDIERVADVFR